MVAPDDSPITEISLLCPPHPRTAGCLYKNRDSSHTSSYTVLFGGGLRGEVGRDREHRQKLPGVVARKFPEHPLLHRFPITERNCNVPGVVYRDLTGSGGTVESGFVRGAGDLGTSLKQFLRLWQTDLAPRTLRRKT